MSPALYHVRCYWCPPQGVAKRGDRSVRLTHPPVLNGEAVEMLDYTPEVNVATVMPRARGWRDMTADEIQQVECLIDQALQADA